MIAEDRPRLLLDSLLLGIIGGLSAQAFMWMLRVCNHFFLTFIAGYTAPGLASEGNSLHQVIGPHWLWLIPVVTTLGGLISGFLVYTWAPEAEGHGTDTAVKAVHWTGGAIRARVAPLKMVASAITIGSGGSAGREGPIALIAAGFGSIYATFQHRPDSERRLLVLMGMAAGLAAIFRSPIGTALFAVEVLYGGIEFEAEALLYCMLAAIVAYAVNGAFTNWQSLFQVPPQVQFTGLGDFGWYVVLGVACGIVGTILPEVFYRVRDLFQSIRLPAFIKPAIGGLLVGLLGMVLPQVLGGGYGWIQEAIDGRLALRLMLLLVVAKIVALSLTVSSGGSGGVYAPSLYIGAMLGGSLAILTHQPPAAMVVIGMASVFGAAARVPIATLIMVVEMTGGYQLLVPAALAVTLSFLVQLRLSKTLKTKYDSLYEGQVVGRIDSPAHRAEQVELALHVLDSGSVTLPPEVSHLHLAALLQSGLALDLPGGERLTAGALRPESHWAGKSIQSAGIDKSIPSAKITTILRGTSVVFPRPQTVLQPGDRLLIIAPQSAEATLAKNLASPSAVVQKEGAKGEDA